MKKYFTKSDDIEAFIAGIKILEMEGENEVISQIRQDVSKALRQTTESGHLGIDWVVMLVLKAREDLRKELTK